MAVPQRDRNDRRVVSDGAASGSAVYAPVVFPPSGTVTFLLTDIEGSTRRWETDAEAMRLALATHDEVLRASVATCGGYLFKHTGDGIAAAFSSANAAVAAAVDAQRKL